MTYSGVTLIVLVSFGVLAWTTSQALRGVATPGMFRQLGITGTRGYHLAAYSITLTVLAAPLDDLWHRTLGLDVKEVLGQQGISSLRSLNAGTSSTTSRSRS